MNLNLKMTVERSKRRSYFLSLVFITKCFTKNLLLRSLQKPSLSEYVQMTAEPQFIKLLVSAIKSSCCVTQDIRPIDPSKVNLLDRWVGHFSAATKLPRTD